MTGKGTKDIPAHLHPFISKQYYHGYTPIDHAVWRFVMKQNHYFFKGNRPSSICKWFNGFGDQD